MSKLPAAGCRLVVQVHRCIATNHRIPSCSHSLNSRPPVLSKEILPVKLTSNHTYYAHSVFMCTLNVVFESEFWKIFLDLSLKCRFQSNTVIFLLSYSPISLSLIVDFLGATGKRIVLGRVVPHLQRISFINLSLVNQNLGLWLFELWSLTIFIYGMWLRCKSCTIHQLCFLLLIIIYYLLRTTKNWWWMHEKF